MTAPKPEYAVMLAPGLPDSTTEAIQRIDRELERTGMLHAASVCMVCGESGRPHVHTYSPVQEGR